MTEVEYDSNARGYWNPSCPSVAADFATLPRDAQNRVIETERAHGTGYAIAQLALEKSAQTQTLMTKIIADLTEGLNDAKRGQ
jgi:hypothetical protein